MRSDRLRKNQRKRIEQDREKKKENEREREREREKRRERDTERNPCDGQTKNERVQEKWRDSPHRETWSQRLCSAGGQEGGCVECENAP